MLVQYLGACLQKKFIQIEWYKEACLLRATGGKSTPQYKSQFPECTEYISKKGGFVLKLYYSLLTQLHPFLNKISHVSFQAKFSPCQQGENSEKYCSGKHWEILWTPWGACSSLSAAPCCPMLHSLLHRIAITIHSNSAMEKRAGGGSLDPL